MSSIRNYKKSKKYINKNVQIKTKQGITYRGKIVKVSKNKVYLKVSYVNTGKKAHVSFFPFILPLVLFDLLVIVLLDTRRRAFF
ncbi:hypothetical protein BVG16_13345 [Paenibacillus selenitireducens]|uniref:Uncharacterized protein n=1 Tax=Paenibacillus selenitireducens TaxID=1324314 RepID=A0A1T2XC83_9BACL|nr:hypothetical protein [Paenibacillus selenitireducens]OPA77438.1 hypothetical protein BVG16_13345 [Paenibacillus selenitireducens]